MTRVRNRLKEVLDEEEMTLRDLERAILLLGGDVSYQALHAIYHNRTNETTFRVVSLICRALDREIDEIFTLDLNDGRSNKKRPRGG